MSKQSQGRRQHHEKLAPRQPKDLTKKNNKVVKAIREYVTQRHARLAAQHKQED